jgi:hypothetical protein
MVSWYMITLSSADISAGKPKQLQEAFDYIFCATGAQRGAAMFDVLDDSRRLGDFYFSPDALRIGRPLLAAFGGGECSAPTRSLLHPLTAHQDLSDIPFASEDSR